MKTASAVPTTVDEYIASFPVEVQRVLVRMRETIRKAAPGAEESISYRIPAYKLDGALVYFGAFQSHIGFYPMTAEVKKRFAKELSSYDGAKGTVRFPFGERLPVGLIARIVKARVEENRMRTAKGRKKT